MDDKDRNLDSLKRVVERLQKLSGDGFSDSMVEILQRELARDGSADQDSGIESPAEVSSQPARSSAGLQDQGR